MRTKTIIFAAKIMTESNVGKFINPFTDVGFKRIYGQEMSKPILITLLNTLLEGEYHIVDLKYLDKELVGLADDDRMRLIYLQLPLFRKELEDCENVFEQMIYVLKNMDVLQRMLNAKGYQAYSFDVSAIKGRNVTFNVREFVNGKEIDDSPRLLFPYIFEAKGDKLVYGFLPSENDSTALCYFNWENTLRSASSLKLRQIYWESEDKYIYSYVSKPFELTMSLEKDTFIPLMCYCSFWYDAEDKVTRCCGENFIKPDLSSDILKYVPHYYVLGIKFY